MIGGLCRRKRLLISLTYIAAIALLMTSELGCVIYRQDPLTSQAWPKAASGFKSYITLECPFVQECLCDILDDSTDEVTRDGFDGIRDWVAYNIDYKSDEERVGKTDDWQTPKETLENPRVGDCEDFSILLCTLLRAYGIDAEQVYVVIGIDGDDSAHAFLMENWYQGGEWRAIEAQAPTKLRHGFPVFPIFDSGLDRYEIIVAFNDLYYYDGSFPWDEDQAKSGTLAEEATGVNNIVRLLSQSLDYLFRILFNENQHDVSCMNNITSILHTFPAFPAMLSD